MQQILSNPIIIGSSDIVLKQKLGSEIDKFGTIVRFNRAPTQNFEEHVGSRTDLRVVNSHVFRNKPKDNEDLSFLPLVKNEVIGHDRGVNTSTFHDVFDKSCTHIKINRYKEFDIIEKNLIIPLQIDLGFKGYEPSLGLGTICYYINNNVIPTVYGFHLHNDDVTVAPHYWNVKPKVGRFHNYSYERKLIRKFAELNLIKILQ